MDQPILDYLPRIQEVASRIPTDRSITKQEIAQFNVNDLKTIFYYTFPENFSNRNYEELGYLVELVNRVMDKIPNNSIIIGSGDSPSKIINLINLLWRVDENIYQQRKSKHSISPVNETKIIKFVRFPLSKIRNIKLSQLSNYLKQILEVNGIDYNRQIHFIDLDYIESGISHQKIEAALKLINRKITLDEINIRDIWIEVADQYSIDLQNVVIFDMIKDAEIYDTRCVPEYNNLELSVPTLNVRQCNLFVTLLYLKAIGQLGQTPSLSYPQIQCSDPAICLADDKFYSIDYYDPATNTVENAYVFINSIWNRAYGFFIEAETVKFRTLGLTLGSVIRFTLIPDEQVYGNHPRNFPEATPLIITLVNNEKIMAEYDGNYFQTARWSTAVIDDELNPSGLILKGLVLTYELAN